MFQFKAGAWRSTIHTLQSHRRSLTDCASLQLSTSCNGRMRSLNKVPGELSPIVPELWPTRILPNGNVCVEGDSPVIPNKHRFSHSFHSSSARSRLRGITATKWLLCYIQRMRHHMLLLALISCAVTSASGQACPESSKTGASVPSEVRTLEGKLIFHDGIRKWFELRLDQPQCGQASIQLVRLVRDWTPIEVLGGCPVQVAGQDRCL